MLHQAPLGSPKATLSLISLAPNLYRKYALVATTNPLSAWLRSITASAINGIYAQNVNQNCSLGLGSKGV